MSVASATGAAAILGPMEHRVELGDGDVIWAEDLGRADGTPLLLIMGANASGMTWPDELVERLGERHRVVRYDHRDTGRSTWAFAQRPDRKSTRLNSSH